MENVEFSKILLPLASPRRKESPLSNEPPGGWFAIIHQIHQHRGSPWLYMYSHGYQIITQRQLKGPQGLLEVTQKNCHFLANPCQPKNS